MHEIINSLFNYALDNDIAVEYTDKLHQNTQSFADVRSRSIVINANWQPRKQLPFIIAHEISHIMQCDQDDAILSFTTLLSPKYEQKANVNAIKLLIPFYADNKEIDQINLEEFMELFAIPDSLRDVCFTEIKDYVD
ncbi:ImmA/IrrE family metallo-endopeptidase [Fructilactobacillus fructivorans]|uniref:ImmA/IrrE family metallo-endopeptidase n=2 Tax=Fructilactobacillus fructivorans TaxID=1614 RepID=A0AAE6P2H9_9LACO|nr:ImmA/IrrE family metallo-endopeptidase [Fructilactobacillus fructivorans]KRK56932.1 hypothetical protein FC73_GL001326 [Fructilactobacillus fructivorans]KRN13212.1 hypothetical protein IV37_GL000854 [Fructilactobacillus fructivorans]QFX93217.1 ImmA/IrrE family metallo-endopeptidase [Fructilactobacillus fructivorans]RDV65037.1 ImmA/IrrE family metallo-endopeptidase [Fructilactobacillus fructivorans]